jgi:hypothetical protein
MKWVDVPVLRVIADFAVEAFVGIIMFAITVTIGVYAVFG